jgi:hypothetical protein
VTEPIGPVGRPGRGGGSTVVRRVRLWFQGGTIHVY